MINGQESNVGMEKQVKILILSIAFGIVVVLVVLNSPSLGATCQSWYSGLYNKYYTLNAQFDSLSMRDPVLHDQFWQDATNEWMTYQKRAIWLLWTMFHVRPIVFACHRRSN